MKKTYRLLVAGAAAMSLAVLLPSAFAGADPQAEIAPGAKAAFAVFDRQTGRTTLAHDEHAQFRSASVVKILIALDYLEKRGPDAEIPQADLRRLVPMLRSSDDNAASELWVQEGWQKIVERMVAKLKLEDTEPPVDVGFWGFTALSAADVVKIYRYVLDQAHPKVRDFIVGNLHQATKCATDGFDQSFGIPSAIRGDVAFKQGWSRFGDTPPRPCGQPQKRQAYPGVAMDGAMGSSAAELDLARPAMHTTGTYGTKDRKIMVVLTLEPEGTTWDVSAERTTKLTRAVYLAERVLG